MQNRLIAVASVVVLLPSTPLWAQAVATEATHVAITASQISCDGKRVAATQPLAADERAVHIEPLIQPLRARIASWMRQHPQQQYPGQVTMEIDAAVTQRVVRKVLFAISQSGFARVHFRRSGATLTSPDHPSASPTLAILWIKPNGLVLASGELVPIDKKADKYDLPELQQRLSALRKLQRAEGRMLLAPDDEVPFGVVSDAMAAAIAAGYPMLGFMPGGPPSILLANTAPRGRLDKNTIRAAIDKENAAVRSCYQKHLARSPASQATRGGKIVVKLVIAESGRVGLAAIEETAFADDALSACVVDAIKRVTFPAPEGGGVIVVSYPFNFGTGE